MQILTDNHRRILVALGKSKLAKDIYFTGGTLLSYRYLQHRYSLDVDIFCDDLLDDLLVTKTMQSVSSLVDAKKMHYTRYPSRWQYLLELKDDFKHPYLSFQMLIMCLNGNTRQLPHS